MYDHLANRIHQFNLNITGYRARFHLPGKFPRVTSCQKFDKEIFNSLETYYLNPNQDWIDKLLEMYKISTSLQVFTIF